MLLSELLKNVNYARKNFADLPIKNISTNSADVCAGDVFVCLVGEKVDGHKFAFEAVKNGAVAIVCHKYIDGIDAVQLKVQNTRQTLSKLCANFYDNPQNKMKFVGVTGTNVKTTTTNLVAHVLQKSGKKVAIVGTNGAFFDGKMFETGLTTPEPVKLYKLLSQMVDCDVEYVVCEISAHAIAYERLFGIVFDVVGITNITQDHLDYFKNMQNYAKTKLDYILSNNVKSVAWCCDDELIRSSDIIKKTGLSYGIECPSDVFATSIFTSSCGTNFFVNFLDNVFEVQTRLIGRFNVQNILCCICICAMLGVSVISCKEGISDFVGVEGRMQQITLKNKACCIIDYAHTPNALENVLKELKQMPHSRLVLVFGCGGDRDKEKRPIMGKIAEMFCDVVIVTSDNPRGENAKEIIKQITSQTKKCKIIQDRAKAISYAIKNSKQGDVIAICGKGHEKYQIIGDKKLYFSDLEEVLRANEKIKV